MSQKSDSDNALDTLTSSAGPSELSDIIRTTKPQTRWALIAIAVAVVILAVWSVVATLPQQIAAQGVVIVPDGQVVVAAPAAGTVNYQKAVGEKVSQGDTLATITGFDGEQKTSAVAPMDGSVSMRLAVEGMGVSEGQSLGVVTQPITTTTPTLLVVTYLPVSQAIRFNMDDPVSLSITDVTSGRQELVTGKIKNVSDVPSTVEAMAVETGSVAFATRFAEDADHIPYRIEIAVPTDQPNMTELIPPPGSVAEIINTYAEPHPIDLLFGGNS